jgi:hypothetical protein
MYFGVSLLEPCGFSTFFTDNNSTLSTQNKFSTLRRNSLCLSGFTLSRSQLVC